MVLPSEKKMYLEFILRAIAKKETDREYAKYIHIDNKTIHATDGFRIHAVQKEIMEGIIQEGIYKVLKNKNEFEFIKVEKEITYPNVYNVVPEDRDGYEKIKIKSSLDIDKSIGEILGRYWEYPKNKVLTINYKFLEDAVKLASQGGCYNIDMWVSKERLPIIFDFIGKGDCWAIIMPTEIK